MSDDSTHHPAETSRLVALGIGAGATLGMVGAMVVNARNASASDTPAPAEQLSGSPSPTPSLGEPPSLTDRPDVRLNDPSRGTSGEDGYRNEDPGSTNGYPDYGTSDNGSSDNTYGGGQLNQVPQAPVGSTRGSG